MPESAEFVFGVDLDGVVADFYSHARCLAAEWFEVPEASLTPAVKKDLAAWGFPDAISYQRLHRWAVTQRNLFRDMPPIWGARSALRRLSDDKVRIRIITHRLYIDRFHQAAVRQTIDWLDHHGIPYRDLCFMADKRAVEADLYIEDTPENIKKLQKAGKEVLIYTNTTNMEIKGERVDDWKAAEDHVRQHLERWRPQSR
ncbi:5' nucleotidase, NT5C type [Streptomyces nigrescens]|uniref:5' nucleotidase, NT5C type n=1 Tax=Streptomyces nigrescens TaxID=1920 RepID=UPI00348B8CF2